MNTRRIVYLALLIATGLALFVFESLIPRPLPWLRLGLGNLATLLALYLLDSKAAVAVALIRALLGAIVIGGLFNPAFLFSLAGGLSSAGLMILVYGLFRDLFSVVGISIWGALAHNLAQLALAGLLFIRHPVLLDLVPVFLLTSLFTGFLTGILGYMVLRRISLHRLGT